MRGLPRNAPLRIVAWPICSAASHECTARIRAWAAQKCTASDCCVADLQRSKPQLHHRDAGKQSFCMSTGVLHTKSELPLSIRNPYMAHRETNGFPFNNRISRAVTLYRKPTGESAQKIEDELICLTTTAETSTWQRSQRLLGLPGGAGASWRCTRRGRICDGLGMDWDGLGMD